MIIPIRCFTCGKTLADKYDYYLDEVRKLMNVDEGASSSKPAKEEKTKKKDKEKKKAPVQEMEGGGLKNFDSVHTGKIMDRMGLTRYCCRRHMLTTVDMMETI